MLGIGLAGGRQHGHGALVLGPHQGLGKRREAPGRRIGKIAAQTAHVDDKRVASGIGQPGHVAGVEYVFGGPDLDTGVAAVIDQQAAGIDLLLQVGGQRVGRAIVFQVGLIRRLQGGRQHGGRVFVHALKGRLFLGGAVVGHQQDVVLPGLVGVTVFVADDFGDHQLGLGRGGRRQAADVKVGHDIAAADQGVPFIGDGLAGLLGENRVGGHVIGGPVAPVVLVVVGGIAHQQHVLRRGGRPEADGIGQKILDGGRGGQPEGKLVVDVRQVDGHHPVALALAQR